MKAIWTATTVGTFAVSACGLPALGAAITPALQFRTIINTTEGKPLFAVGQLVAETGGGVVAMVAPAETFDIFIVDHPGAAHSSSTEGRTLFGMGSEIPAIFTLAVSNSPSLGRLVTFSGFDDVGGMMYQHRVDTDETRPLVDRDTHGSYSPIFFDVNTNGQVLFLTDNAGAGQVVRATMTQSSIEYAVEDRYNDRSLGFPSYIAPNGSAYIVHHPPAGQAREIWRSQMVPAVTPDTLVHPGQTINGNQTDPYTILGANNNQVLYTAIATSPAGRDAIYLRTDSSGLISYEELYSAPTVGEDFAVLGLLTPSGRGAATIFEADQTHLRYWDGESVHGWTFTTDAFVQFTEPMVGDGGDWVVFYALVPDAEQMLHNAIMAWNPVMEIDPFVVVQAGGQIDLAGEGLVSIAEVQILASQGVLKDALSDANELAVAFRRDGSDYYEIATVTLPVPEPTMLTMLAVLPFMRRRRRRA